MPTSKTNKRFPSFNCFLKNCRKELGGTGCIGLALVSSLVLSTTASAGGTQGRTMSPLRQAVYKLWTNPNLSEAERCRGVDSLIETRLTSNPLSDEAYGLHARSKNWCGDALSGFKEATRALSLNKNNTDAKLALATSKNALGDTAGASNNIDELLKLLPNSARVITTKADIYFDLGDYNSAIGLYHLVLAHFVEDDLMVEPTIFKSHVYCSLAAAYSNINKLDQTSQSIAAAEKLGTSEPCITIKKADLMWQRGQHNAAIKTLDPLASRIQTMDPADSFDFYITRGNARASAKDYQGAIADSKLATKVKPNDAVGWNNLCWHYLESGDAKTALPHCNRAIKLSPLDGNIYDSRGRVYLSLGNWSQGCKDLAIASKQGLKESTDYLKSPKGKVCEASK
jgi:tetratricopeptide (TPR) repeat protein